MDLNDFDAYDYEQPKYDASSGLPPPEALIDVAADNNSGVEEPSAVGDEVPADDAPAAHEEPPCDDVVTAADEIPATDESSATDAIHVVDEVIGTDKVPVDAVSEGQDSLDPAFASVDLPAKEEVGETETNAIAIAISSSTAEDPGTEHASAAPEEQPAEEV